MEKSERATAEVKLRNEKEIKYLRRTLKN